jgi:hypothetical protein
MCNGYECVRWIALVLAAILLAGCGGEASRPAAPAASTQVAPPPPPPPPPTAPAAPEMVRKKAEKGVGEKGRGYGTGIVATPAAALFAAKERIAFDIQIPQAMQLFKAGEGRAPKSHDEFMEKIVKFNHINLPTLHEGHRYVYDPKAEQLMVEQPAPK